MHPVTKADHIANVLDVLELHRDPGIAVDLNGPLDALIDHLDWNAVPLDAIKTAIGVILNAATDAEVEALSEVADNERIIITGQVAAVDLEKRIAEMLDIDREQAARIIERHELDNADPAPAAVVEMARKSLQADAAEAVAA